MENKKYEIISYNTDDGSVNQTITLGFNPRLGQVSKDCNNDYLAVMDVLGNAHIYKYYYPPHPKPHHRWDIIVLIVALMIIVGGIFRFIIHQ